MPRLIERPATIEAAGNRPKQIHGYVAICLPAFSSGIVHRDKE